MIRRSLLALGLILLGSVFASTVMPDPVQADACGEKGRILTLKPWYYGLMTDDCSGFKEAATLSDGNSGIGKFIWIIVLNIVEDLLHIAGYITVGFIIYGGFIYMTSGGAPDRAAAGQKTVLNAAIGLVIAIAAIGLVNFVAAGLSL